MLSQIYCNPYQPLIFSILKIFPFIQWTFKDFSFLYELSFRVVPQLTLQCTRIFNMIYCANVEYSALARHQTGKEKMNLESTIYADLSQNIRERNAEKNTISMAATMQWQQMCLNRKMKTPFFMATIQHQSLKESQKNNRWQKIQGGKQNQYMKGKQSMYQVSIL